MGRTRKKPRKGEKRKNSCPTNPRRLLFLLQHPLNELPANQLSTPTRMTSMLMPENRRKRRNQRFWSLSEVVHPVQRWGQYKNCPEGTVTTSSQIEKRKQIGSRQHGHSGRYQLPGQQRQPSVKKKTAEDQPQSFKRGILSWRRGSSPSTQRNYTQVTNNKDLFKIFKKMNKRNCTQEMNLIPTKHVVERT